jgi:hypothetical protein
LDQYFGHTATLFQLLVERLFEEICRIELHGFDGERHIAMAPVMTITDSP